MFFLLRMTFWLGLVLVLLPRDPAPNADNKAPQLGAVEAFSAATAAMSDMSQFCTRQPAACEVGGQAAAYLGERAQGGARKVYQFLMEQSTPEHSEKDAGKAASEKDKAAPDHTSSISHPLASPARDTLTPADRKIKWRGPIDQASTALPAVVSRS
ncbi:MAG TPA: DUF5330 domain-containing protein [Xanthobacteraceae bacterium]|nr:DUF5330 domain-containing protein [Xanthobacteraceae bacterium]